jgi:hypothetical protein
MKKMLYLLIGMLLLIPCTVNAANLIKDDLVNAATYFNGLCTSEEKDAFLNEQGTCVNPANMEVLDDKVKVTASQNGQQATVEISYNIAEDGKIVFNFRAPVANGQMTKDDYRKIKDFNKIFVFPALLVSNSRGAAVKDYLAYLSKAIPGISPKAQGQEGDPVTNCTNGSEATPNCMTIDPTQQYSDEEFPSHVMEIAEQQYGSVQPIQDNKSDQINSFVLSTSLVKNDDNSGYIDFTMSVDSNADFTKVAGLYEEMSGQKESVDPEPQPEPKPEQKKEDNPKTGAKLEIVLLIGMAIIALVLLKVYGRKAIHNI